MNKNYQNPYFSESKTYDGFKYKDYNEQNDDIYKTINKNTYENQMEEVQKLPKTIQPV